MPALTTPYVVLKPQRPVLDFIETAKTERDKLFNKLRDAFTEGDTKARRKYRDRWFRDKMVKLAFLHKAGVRHATIDDWLDEVRDFDPFKPIPHVVDWYRRAKKTNGYRIVCDLSPQLKAAHYMITEALLAQFDVPEFIYNVRPLGEHSREIGRNALVRAMVEKLHQGYGHYRVYDVRDCFQQVAPGALEQLPLPRRIYENTLNLTNIQFRHDQGRDQGQSSDNSLYGDIQYTAGASGPSGLMQGSPCSNAILAYLLQDMPQPDPQDGCLLQYGDDLISLARSESISARVDRNLVQFFGQPCLGPLPLCQNYAGHEGYFEFLGYGFRYDPYGRTWEVTPSERNWKKLERVRQLRALRWWPRTGLGVDTYVADRLMRRLQSHTCLTDPQGVLDALMAGGFDADQMERARAEQAERATQLGGMFPLSTTRRDTTH